MECLRWGAIGEDDLSVGLLAGLLVYPDWPRCCTPCIPRVQAVWTVAELLRSLPGCRGRRLRHGSLRRSAVLQRNTFRAAAVRRWPGMR